MSPKLGELNPGLVAYEGEHFLCAGEAVDERAPQSIFQGRAANTPHKQQLTIETERDTPQEGRNTALHSGGFDIHLGLI